MAKLTAIEWDSREARIAVGQLRGGRLSIAKAITVPLAPREASGHKIAADLAARLSAAMATLDVAKGEVIIGLGRSGIQLRILDLPDVPNDELPDIVRFQSQREMTAGADDWAIDYLPLDDAADQGKRRVLAAAVSEAQLHQAQSLANELGHKVRRVVVRPCAAASLLLRVYGNDGQRIRLLIDPLADEADLTVLVDQKVVLTRTVRLPAESDEDATPALISEIRRTLAAAQNQLHGERVEQIYLCGRDDEQASLKAAIDAELKISVTTFDPMKAVESESGLVAPDRPSRFAPLFGMLWDEAEGVRPAIDFLHPRRPPAPPDRRRLYTLAASAAAAAVLLLFGWVWVSLWAMDDEIASLRRESQQLDTKSKQLAIKQKEVRDIDRWAISDIVWLDQLAELSKSMPEAKDVKLSGMSAIATLDGGRIDLDGLVRQSSVIDAMESSLRNDQRRVEAKGSQADDSSSKYSLRFTNSLILDRKNLDPVSKTPPPKR